MKVLSTFFRTHLLSTALVALLFAVLLASFLVYQFESPLEKSNIHSIGDALWWGFVTVFTVGYGEYYPTSLAGRIIAVVLMFGGLATLSVVTARIAAFFLHQALNKRRGVVTTESLNQHIIICGWKEDIRSLLFDILEVNKDLKSADIVLINNKEEHQFESLTSEPLLKGLKWIRGDFFSEAQLIRAAPERARKVIILADSSAATATEADARTIMTAMSLNSLAKYTPKVAEILDAKMDAYLKLAHVNEIVYSREYARLLLGKASMGLGVTNVFHDLLDSKSGAGLLTVQIPESFIGKTFTELQGHFFSHQKSQTVIGVLENSGNIHNVKDLALRRAQMTSDVSLLVENLNQVKNIELNKPQFSPRPDYIIQEGSLAIVIQSIEVKKGNTHAAMV